MIEFILAQVTGGIALVLVVFSYYAKRKTTFFVLQIFSNIFYGLSFIFSHSLVAGINTLISIIRIIELYYFEKSGRETPAYLIIVYSCMYIAVGIAFYNSMYDIIPIITPIIFTVAMWMKNMQLIRYTMLLPQVALFIYAIICQAYTSALLNLIELVAIIIAIFKYYIEYKKSRKNLLKQ